MKIGFPYYFHDKDFEQTDLIDYSLLPNGLVSMLTYFSMSLMSGADRDYIPMFSWKNLFLTVLRLNNKVIFNPTKQYKHKT